MAVQQVLPEWRVIPLGYVGLTDGGCISTEEPSNFGEYETEESACYYRTPRLSLTAYKRLVEASREMAAEISREHA